MPSDERILGPKRPVVDMDTDRTGLLISLLPKIPLITRVIILHLLRYSEQSKYWDMRTEVIIAMLRSYMSPPKPLSITATQRLLVQDLEVKGRIWISRYTCPAPEDRGVADAVKSAIDALRDDDVKVRSELRLPDVAAVEAEWTGYRADATPESRLPDVSEKEKYDMMMKGVTSSATILYLHGGAFWLMDPATHRTTTKRLAKVSGGRCYSVRYRLSPQHVFPAALMDALTSYLALLYPPPEAFHDPVPAEHIVFAGDSAGGNLALALIQTLLQLRRQNIPIVWQGQSRHVPLPAGVAVSSPWVDITHSSPSCETNVDFDYLPPLQTQLDLEPSRPPCVVWPANPPRRMLYADDDMIMHPLVTLLMAPSWAGAPPVWICTGKELLTDEDKFMAHKLWKDGVKVTYEEYEGMPHCFALLFERLAEARRCINGWAGFAKAVVEQQGQVPEGFRMIRAKTSEEEELDPEMVCPYSLEDIRERLEMGMKALMGGGGRVTTVVEEMSKL